MNQSDFSDDSPGRLVPIEFTEYPNGHQAPPVKVRTSAFVPDPLPPRVDWKSIKLEHFDRHTETVAALSKLNGLHKRIGNASGLLRTLWMREAKLSSAIEHIDTTAEDLVLSGAGRTSGVRESGRESWNYVRALEHGVSSTLPWSTRLIREMHKLLLSAVQGEEKRPGELRNCGVYLGEKSRGAGNALMFPCLQVTGSSMQ